MAVAWDAARFASSYAVRDRDPSSPTFGQTFSYGRRLAELAASPLSPGLTLYENRRDKLIELFGIQPADRILIAGSGFGYLIEVFRDAGFSNVWGIDSSAEIESRKGVEARADIRTLWIADDIRGGGRILAALRSLTGDDVFDWVVSESMLEGYADGELAQLFAAAEAVLKTGRPLSSIVHMVVPIQPQTTQDPAFNWKTLADWNALRPAHSWLDLTTWEVL